MENETDYSPVHTHRQSRSKVLILLIILVGLSLVIMIVFIVLHVLKRDTSNCTQYKHANICLTPDCVKTANHLLETIDETIDPCEDFYQFTCGSWMRKTNLSNNTKMESSFTKLANNIIKSITDILLSSPSNNTIKSKAIANARHFYRVCINDTYMKINNIDRIFSSIFYETKIESHQFPQDLTETLLQLNGYNAFSFFQIKTAIDFDSSKTLKYIIQLTPASEFHNDHISDEYYKFLATETTARNILNTSSLSQLENEIRPYLFPEHIDIPPKQIITTMKNLTQLINTTFDFSNYLHRLYRLANITLTDNDTVIIYLIENIRALASIITKQSQIVLYQYLFKNYLITYATHFLSNSSTEQDNIQIKCTQYISKYMNSVISKLYIDKYFDNDARQESNKIAKNIQETFVDMVQQSKWMDNNSKKRTIEKIKHIRSQIGYSDYLKSDNFLIKLETEYAKYEFTSSHLKNILLMRQYYVRQNLQKIRHIPTEDDYNLFSPITINAFYNPILNQFVFPTSLLQPPFFRKNVPKYLNYGAFGSVVGHEITHGFDEFRRHWNIDGSLYKFWSNKTTEMYNKRSKCIIDQYNNYTVSQINLQINGTLTLNENIADTDGLKKAFYAYKKWESIHKINEEKMPGLQKYTAEQMFFISFGQLYCSKASDSYATKLLSVDNHSPYQFRLIGSTSNFIEFDRAFHCKAGQNNSRINKCKVW